jgi:hypothetical protein
MSERGTADIVVIMLTATVCSIVLLAGATLLVLSILRPDADVTPLIGAVSHALTTMIGLLAGFAAGRSLLRRNRD